MVGIILVNINHVFEHFYHCMLSNSYVSNLCTCSSKVYSWKALFNVSNLHCNSPAGYLMLIIPE